MFLSVMVKYLIFPPMLLKANLLSFHCCLETENLIKMQKIFLLTDKKIVSLESIEMGMNGLLPEGYLYTKLHLHIVYLLKTSNIKINHHLGGTILRKKCALKFKSRKLPSFSVALLDITPFGLNRVLSSLMDWKM